MPRTFFDRTMIGPLLSDAKPMYVGTTYIETYLHDADARHAASARLVGEGGDARARAGEFEGWSPDLTALITDSDTRAGPSPRARAARITSGHGP